MKIGTLVKLKRNDTIWIVAEICPLGNIGLWNSSLRFPNLRWTHTGAIKLQDPVTGEF